MSKEKVIYKFYELENMTQEDLNTLASERNQLARDNQQLKEELNTCMIERNKFLDLIEKAINKLGRYADEMTNNANAYAICVDLLDTLKEQDDIKEENTNLKQALIDAREYIHTNSHYYSTDDGNVDFVIEEEKEVVMNNFMNIDIKEYLKKYIGHTDWYGESEYDNESCYNLSKLDKVLTEIEDLREELLIKLKKHKNYRKGNKSAELLHKQAKDIMSKHIIKEFTHTDFEKFWESSDE